MLRHDAETLRFRRQFAIGETELPGFPSWPRTSLGKDLCLTAHPDVESAHVTRGQHSVLAIGLVIDTERPGATAAQIAEQLLTRLEGGLALDAFAGALDHLAGRWALIATQGNDACVFHDAAGTRQLFFTTPEAGVDRDWCASSPDLLAHAFSIPRCPAATEWMASADFARQRESWWPGDRTPYEGVHLLLPNHALNWSSHQAVRYGPTEPLQKLGLDEAVATSARLLQAAMEGAVARRPLALSLTAGFDSRVSLAAALCMHPVLPFSFVHEEIGPRHPDVVVPSRLATLFGTRHLVFTCPHVASTAFADAYRASNPLGNPTWAAVAEGLYENLPDDVLRVTSTVSEIGRAFYRPDGDISTENLDGRKLAALTRLGSHPWVQEAFDDWLRTIPTDSSLHPLDLFYWEQRLGSWAGTLFREWDIAHEGFSPFTCRALMRTFLAVDECHRTGPAYTLHTELIRALWPEALREPINPPVPGRWLKRLRKRSQRIRKWLKNRSQTRG
jgi:hypothetical protein